jgi:L-ribulose-5-phosphate 3-epimerase
LNGLSDVIIKFKGVIMNSGQSFLSRRKMIQKTLATSLAIPIIGLSKNESKRPICVFSKHLQWCKSFDEMAAVAAEIGFDGVDLTVRKGGHVPPEKVVELLPKAVKAVEKAGLQVYMMTAGVNDPDDKWTVPVLKTASEHGIGYYRMGYLRYDEKLGVAKSLPALRKKLAKLADLNEKYKIHGAYQNHAGARVGGPVWDIWDLIKDLDSQWIGCQYDIRHAHVEGATSWPLGFNLLKDHTKIIAIKDFKWGIVDGKWKPINVALAKGMVDFDRYFKLYKQYQISGPISLHYEYPLGGADHGNRELSISQAELKKAMKADLVQLKAWLDKAGL